MFIALLESLRRRPLSDSIPVDVIAPVDKLHAVVAAAGTPDYDQAVADYETALKRGERALRSGYHAAA